MQSFIAAQASTSDLIALNRCRLYIYAFHLSDVTSGDGTAITDEAWLGEQSPNHLRKPSWGAFTISHNKRQKALNSR